MYKQLLLFFLFLSPSLLFCQEASWIDGTRYRLTQGFASFMPQPLWGRYLYLEHWQAVPPRDIQWGLGLRTTYVTEEERPFGSYVYQIGERRFEKTLMLELTATPALVIFYVHRAGSKFAGRFRLEVPVGLAALIGGGEKLERIDPIIVDGRVVGERPIWHREGPFLLRPTLGAGFSYTHRITAKWAIGTQWGYIGILEMGGSMRGGFLLERRI